MLATSKALPLPLPSITSLPVLHSMPSYTRGDVTLLVVNTYHSSTALILLNSLNDKAKDVYFLTPLNYDIRSKYGWTEELAT